MNKDYGELKLKCSYTHIDKKKHFIRILPLNALATACIFLAIYNEINIFYTLFFALNFIWMNVYWARRLPKFNNRDTYDVYSKGVLHKHEEGKDFYYWGEIKGLNPIEEYQHKLKTPGFNIYVRDNKPLFIGESIDGYLEFFEILKQKSIEGSSALLPLNELDIYGRVR